MTIRLKAKKIVGIRVKGRIIKSTKDNFKVKISINKYSKKEMIEGKRKELIHKIIELEKENYGEYIQPMENSNVNVIYLNEHSMKGHYLDPKKNLPYEILDIRSYRIYKQDILTPKEKILTQLEKSELKKNID